MNVTSPHTYTAPPSPPSTSAATEPTRVACSGSRGSTGCCSTPPTLPPPSHAPTAREIIPTRSAAVSSSDMQETPTSKGNSRTPPALCQEFWALTSADSRLRIRRSASLLGLVSSLPLG